MCNGVLHSAGGPYIKLIAIPREEEPGLCFAPREEKQVHHLHLLSKYPRGVVGKMLDCHLNVSGSIPTPAMIFLLGFYQCSSFSLERDREREKIGLINESFPLLNIERLKFESEVK